MILGFSLGPAHFVLTVLLPAAYGVCLQEKLCLDLDEAQARDRLQQLINESATALMPQIVETTHRWAQYWR
jgi:hypothetical protein